MNINWKDLKELELNNLGEWPVPMVGILIICASVCILLIGYWFDLRGQIDRLEEAHSEEIYLKTNFLKKVQTAVNLPGYKLQLANMKKTFGGLLRQLPEQTEVPALLEDISHQGLATGLEFQSIRLKPERVIDFYVELPIEISVTGNYQEFAEFISNISALPRIVTLHDFVIQAAAQNKNQNQNQASNSNPNPNPNPNQNKDINSQSKKESSVGVEANTEKLVMSVTAKTYRYIVDREHHAQP